VVYFLLKWDQTLISKSKTGAAVKKIKRLANFPVLTDTQVRLILFALDTHPLGSVFPFKALSRKIE